MTCRNSGVQLSKAVRNLLRGRSNRLYTLVNVNECHTTRRASKMLVTWACSFIFAPVLVSHARSKGRFEIFVFFLSLAALRPPPAASPPPTPPLSTSPSWASAAPSASELFLYISSSSRSSFPTVIHSAATTSTVDTGVVAVPPSAQLLLPPLANTKPGEVSRGLDSCFWFARIRVIIQSRG